jgi:sortase A
MRLRVRPRFRLSGLVRTLANVLLGVGGLALLVALIGYVSIKIYQRSENQKFDSELHHLTAPRIPSSSPKFELNPGSPFGRLEIPRLQLSAMVIEGVAGRDLHFGIGYIPGTALPGDSGNVGLAGHRDTFFRKLGQVHAEDAITLTTLIGVFKYRVVSTSIVDPTAVEVLDPTPGPELTLVTCYPFYYVGNAPRRFIVHARRVKASLR